MAPRSWCWRRPTNSAEPRRVPGMAVDTRHAAGHGAGHRRAGRRGARLHRARSDYPLRRRAHASLPGERRPGGRILRPPYPGAVRHAAQLSRLSRGSARRPGGRPLHGHAPLRRARTGPGHRAPGAGAARADGAGHDAGLRRRNPSLHPRLPLAGVVSLCRGAPVAPGARRAAPRPRHHADQRQCPGGPAGQVGAGPGRADPPALPRAVAAGRERPGRGRASDTPEGERTVRARRGVVLACGGFPHDLTRQQALFPHVARGQGITRRHPPATPATAWRWPRRWACGWTQRFRTPRPGRRCRGPRAATANKA